MRPTASSNQALKAHAPRPLVGWISRESRFHANSLECFTRSLGDGSAGLIRKSALASLIVDRGDNIVVDRGRLHALIVVGRRAECAGQKTVRTTRDGRAVQAVADHIRGPGALPGQRNRVWHRGWRRRGRRYRSWRYWGRRYGSRRHRRRGVHHQGNGCSLAGIGLAGCGHVDLKRGRYHGRREQTRRTHRSRRCAHATVVFEVLLTVAVNC